MTLYGSNETLRTVSRVVYEFQFADADKTRALIATLYGLDKDHVAGEHALQNGVHLVVRISADKTGTIDLRDASADLVKR